jgi:hypothetical protein
MIVNTFRLITILMFCVSLIACSKTEDEMTSSDPSNFDVMLNVADDNSGKISIELKANNAAQYQFDSGESQSEPEINTTGVFSHQYKQTGLYLVEVRAIGSSGRYIKETRELSIQVGTETGPIDGEDGYITPLSYDGMKLTWQDEFNGTGLNLTNWNFETGRGSGGWGNNELQYYRSENTSVKDGFLTIEAKKESFQGASYTSSRLTTQNKFTFKYGRVDIRARLPYGQGIWPALWMLGKNINTVGWPACGEVDIMEMIGGGPGRDNKTHGTLHWDEAGNYASTGGSKQIATGNLADKFYVYTITWDASKIKWYLDDVEFKVIDISSTNMSEFRDQFFLIFNVAVGGNWPGSPNGSTVFPQKMTVDYVRVFQSN